MDSRYASVMVMSLLMFSSVAIAADDDNNDEKSTMLEAEIMVGVDGPFVGNSNPIRGINGGGRTWVLKNAKIELSSAGKLNVRVKGLIIPLSAGPGLNPVAFFRAVVSCLSTDLVGNPITVNVSTTNGAEVMIGDPERGDAKIRQTLDLPSPCVAPIVFVTSPGGSWFAATGR